MIENQIIKLYVNGNSMRDIVNIANVKYHKVRSILHNSNADIRPHQFQSKNFDDEKIISLYLSGKSVKEVFCLCGSSITYINTLLNKHKIEKHKKIDKFKKEISLLYGIGFSIKQVARCLSLPPTNVSRRVKAYKISRTISQAKRDPKIYHNIFNNQSKLESCYWAGLLAADGCICKDGSISLALNIQDKSHVEKFRRFVNCTKPSKHYDNMSCLRFGSQEMRQDLANNFNIVHRKTHILTPPANLSSLCAKEYIRGYIDGDGCIHKRKEGVSMAGTYNMMEWIKYNIQLNVKEAGNPSIVKARGYSTYQITFNGRVQSGAICKWLYKNSYEDIRLDRKYNIAINKYNLF